LKTVNRLRKDNDFKGIQDAGRRHRVWFTLLIAVSVQLGISLSHGRVRNLYPGAAQDQTTKSSASGPEGIQRGRKLFDADCSGCHGPEGRGGSRGPDLAGGHSKHGDSDSAVFGTIAKGLPDTGMPAFRLRDEEVWDVISFLRSLRETGPADPLKVEEGKNIFFGRGDCSRCHMLNGQGGRLGPDLSNTDSPMTPNYLARAIRDPGSGLPVDKSAFAGIGADRLKKYAKVTLIYPDGTSITGVRLNEDSFSVQLMDPEERIHLVLKQDLKQVVHDQGSMMPAYDEKMLSDAELENLVVFVMSLKSK
jgi:cytochrome c oxidase cbb3-type subunit III